MSEAEVIGGFFLVEDEFGVFIGDAARLVCRGFFATVEAAKRRVQELATAECCESFVLDLVARCEVGRFFPPRRAVGCGS